MEVFIARQPIFDDGSRLVAYELLFRGGLQNAMPDIDGDAATAKVMANAFLTLGLDQLSDHFPVAINFTQDLLEKEVPLLLPRESTMIEVLPDVLPTERVVACCKKLASSKYAVTIDQYQLHDPREVLVEFADAVKIDVQNNDWATVVELVQSAAALGKRLIASKVETVVDYERCSEAGFDWFQGYYFSQPAVFAGTDLSASKISLLRMLAEINSKEFDFERLEQMITHDIATSYKLLRYINSSLFRRPREITSIKQAMVLLGQDEVRRFLSLIVTATLATDRPSELMRDACVKARMGALLAEECHHTALIQDEMFTVGLFSNIDAILDQPIAAIMETLPLEAHIKEALVDGTGDMGLMLSLINAYIRGRWQHVSLLAKKLRLRESILHEHYRAACEWSSHLF